MRIRPVDKSTTKGAKDTKKTMHLWWRVALALLVGVATSAQTQAPAAVCSVATAESRATVTRVPLELSNNPVYVTACAGTRALDFLLDTGAGQTFFDLNTAKSLGVEMGASFRARGAGAGGVVRRHRRTGT